MTRAERLLILLTADAVIAGAMNPCAKVEVAALAKARHALDDEAFRIARGDSLDDGTIIAPLKSEPNADVLERVRHQLAAGSCFEVPAGMIGPAERSQAVASASDDHHQKSLQALDAALADILAITEATHWGEDRAHAALLRIDTLARNARRWLELESEA